MLKRYSGIIEDEPEADIELSGRMIKFRFSRTPQLRHQFRCPRGKHVFPCVKIDVFEAIPEGDVYHFRGVSAAGSVPRTHFLQALAEGYLVLEKE